VIDRKRLAMYFSASSVGTTITCCLPFLFQGQLLCFRDSPMEWDRFCWMMLVVEELRRDSSTVLPGTLELTTVPTLKT